LAICACQYPKASGVKRHSLNRYTKPRRVIDHSVCVSGEPQETVKGQTRGRAKGACWPNGELSVRLGIVLCI
ncbi:MAG: hypothetical protein WAK33_20320, partial [Silvibacterium sp.]